MAECSESCSDVLSTHRQGTQWLPWTHCQCQFCGSERCVTASCTNWRICCLYFRVQSFGSARCVTASCTNWRICCLYFRVQSFGSLRRIKTKFQIATKTANTSLAVLRVRPPQEQRRRVSGPLTCVHTEVSHTLSSMLRLHVGPHDSCKNLSSYLRSSVDVCVFADMFVASSTISATNSSSENFFY
jgi:hypothetical protein